MTDGGLERRVHDGNWFGVTEEICVKGDAGPGVKTWLALGCAWWVGNEIQQGQQSQRLR